MADLEVTGHEETDYQLTASTTNGVKDRKCPCCNKLFKTERLGAHFKKAHLTEYEALFTVPFLTSSIENKALVGFTIQYQECDTKFLHCLSCLSVRTTDRNHFGKNPTHKAEHVELAEKMIAKKTGVKYINTSITATEKLQRDLEKVRRELKLKQKECHEEHGQYDTYILLKAKENDTLTTRNEELEAELKELKVNFESRGNRIEHLEKNIKVVAQFIKSGQDDLEGLYSQQKEAKFNSCNIKLASAYKWCANP